jgi:hypothetical protein
MLHRIGRLRHTRYSGFSGSSDGNLVRTVYQLFFHLGGESSEYLITSPAGWQLSWICEGGPPGLRLFFCSPSLQNATFLSQKENKFIIIEASSEFFSWKICHEKVAFAICMPRALLSSKHPRYGKPTCTGAVIKPSTWNTKNNEIHLLKCFVEV